ncbi:hypothetical protein [Fusobacterium sp. PH5-44]|uniref:hypothetical protein n=1 Tax=unclassified Fusobacterium TaxID=2648384 RepID=UPI003D245A89
MKLSNKKILKSVLILKIMILPLYINENLLGNQKYDIGVASNPSHTMQSGKVKRVTKYNGFRALLNDRYNFPNNGIIYTQKNNTWTVKTGTYWVVPDTEEADEKDFIIDEKGKKYPLALVSSGVGIIDLVEVEIFQQIINKQMNYDLARQDKQEDEYIKALSYYLQHGKFLE